VGGAGVVVTTATCHRRIKVTLPLQFGEAARTFCWGILVKRGRRVVVHLISYAEGVVIRHESSIIIH
jgi:hypothetical protein